MSTKVGINGFGRIGRLAFRRCVEEGLEVVAINDLSSAENLAYLLKHDTAHGAWEVDNISFNETGIIYKGKAITIFKEKDPHNIPWGKLGVDVVIESTGHFTNAEDCKAHLDAGAKAVVISAPAKDKGTPTYVFGVNTNKLTKEQTVISVA